MRIGSGLGDIFMGQGDYWQLTRGGGHGDYRTIVLAPNSVQENVETVQLAFDLAEKYLHPVIIASDAGIGQMMEPVELPDFKDHDINKFDWAVRGCKEDEPMRACQNIYYAKHSTDYPEYLTKKYNDIEENEQRWESYQVEDAEVVLVAYGSSSRVAKDTVDTAREQGFKLGLIRPITLWPFPKKAFAEAKAAKAFCTVEVNILGQMVDDVKLATEGKFPVGFAGNFFAIPDPDRMLELGEGQRLTTKGLVR